MFWLGSNCRIIRKERTIVEEIRKEEAFYKESHTDLLALMRVATCVDGYRITSMDMRLYPWNKTSHWWIKSMRRV